MTKFIFLILIILFLVPGDCNGQSINDELIRKESFNKYYFEGQELKLSEMGFVFDRYHKTSRIYKRNRLYHKGFRIYGIITLSSAALSGIGAIMLHQDDPGIALLGILVLYPSVLVGAFTASFTILTGVSFLTSKLKLKNKFNKFQREEFYNDFPHLGLGATQNGIGFTLTF